MVKKRKERFHTFHVIEKSLRHHVIEWIATILSVVAATLNANILGITSFNTYFISFYIFFLADLLWISFAVKHKHWGVFTTFFLFGVVNFLAILKNAEIFRLY